MTVATQRFRKFGRVARATVVWFAVAFVGVNLAALLLIDVARPDLRDPEYGKRVASLREQVDEHPGRPLITLIGSSRSAMAVSPEVWESSRASDAEPLLFNMSRLGAGPLTNLLTLRRLHRDGIKPTMVVFELWPPLFDQSGPFAEPVWFEADRFFLADLPFVRGYLPDADRVEHQMLAARFNPVAANRRRWLARIAPSWLPSAQRNEPGSRGIDSWGWLPGWDEHPQNPAARAARVNHHAETFRRHFSRYAISPNADRAIREAVALAREQGARVAFAYLPESTEFRGWVPPNVETAGRGYIAALCAELDVPLIDCRDWLADEWLADGFHPTRAGAAEFTRRFAPAAASLLAR